MPSDYVRFLHAGDFHLERPLQGLLQIPDELRERLADAGRLAAQRVFETALLEEVDFILLSGNVLDPRSADPRCLAFLLEQFEQLRDQGIATYWAGGRVDRPEYWPESVTLPDGVHVFAADRVEEISHFRDDRPIAGILGTSQRQFRAADFRREVAAPVNVAVAAAGLEAAAVEHLPVDYWALGGRHDRQALSVSTTTAQFAGSPQGNSPAEPGAHGCLLVRAGDGARPHVQFVATDAVRWQTVRVNVGDMNSRDDLQALLAERIRGLATESPEQPLLVTCVVESSGRLGARLRQEGLDEEILRWLRRQLLKSSPPVWTVSLEAPFGAEIPSDWQEEDTILGDYLRAVDQFQSDPRQSLAVEGFLPEAPVVRGLESLLRIGSDDERRQILAEAAHLGADLLRGDHV